MLRQKEDSQYGRRERLLPRRRCGSQTLVTTVDKNIYGEGGGRNASGLAHGQEKFFVCGDLDDCELEQNVLATVELTENSN